MTYRIGNVVGWPKRGFPHLQEWIVAEVQQGTFLYLVSLSSANKAVNVPVTDVEFLAYCVTDHILQVMGIEGEL